ncbi:MULTISPECIES: hypothetical protein [Delftia]|uniref:hypothetical protein n=1 Tax=Delftia TaxID=80865 RepID=UPI000F821EC5|nr:MULTISPECIES: hypothetical protein [Delftia]WEM00087.1 hypothetical protein PW274_07315 [Delftia tsuruhatensis]
MLETQPVPLEQLKAQRDKAWEEVARLDWLICKEQNRLSDECRKQRDAWLDQREVGKNFQNQGPLADWQFRPRNMPDTYIG